MRHIATLIAAVIIAPLAWVLLAFGEDRSLQVITAGEKAGVLHGSDFVKPVLVLAAAGALLGLIATLRFSPLGAFAAGTLYAASYLLLLAAPGSVLNLFRHTISIGRWHADASTPLRTGTTLMLGGVLMVAVFSVARWRRWPHAERASTDDWLSADTSRTGEGGSFGHEPAFGTEPETSTRYPTSPRSAGSVSSWVDSLRSGYGAR